MERPSRTFIPETSRTKHYGMLIADIVRHIARAFKVHQYEVWEWVDKERHHPTTEVEEV